VGNTAFSDAPQWLSQPDDNEPKPAQIHSAEDELEQAFSMLVQFDPMASA
jgi:hypothetical protein